ncbi:MULTISPECIES: response regulator [unclassified Bradyrhizobium]|uniref:response regulator n=1 Tax=unclassified Bradyrhizobium TaxID=2631580 RepID=UPI001FF71AD3|nr:MULTISPECIES: response regulator [unclassified Bradyrhizobium]MCK1534700.1 response regulator [Bradyrhizobium sp. 176]
MVEDVAPIRMMFCDMLEELGDKVIAEAGTLKEAIEVARVVDFDLAILDLRLADETTELVAEITRGRGLQFFFLTGHTSDGLPGGFRNAPRLEKPVLCSALAEMIENCARS